MRHMGLATTTRKSIKIKKKKINLGRGNFDPEITPNPQNPAKNTPRKCANFSQLLEMFSETNLPKCPPPRPGLGHEKMKPEVIKLKKKLKQPACQTMPLKSQKILPSNENRMKMIPKVGFQKSKIKIQQENPPTAPSPVPQTPLQSVAMGKIETETNLETCHEPVSSSPRPAPSKFANQAAKSSAPKQTKENSNFGGKNMPKPPNQSANRSNFTLASKSADWTAP